jgi:hypothetical protein
MHIDTTYSGVRAIGVPLKKPSPTYTEGKLIKLPFHLFTFDNVNDLKVGVSACELGGRLYT